MPMHRLSPNPGGFLQFCCQRRRADKGWCTSFLKNVANECSFEVTAENGCGMGDQCCKVKKMEKTNGCCGGKVSSVHRHMQINKCLVLDLKTIKEIVNQCIMTNKMVTKSI